MEAPVVEAPVAEEVVADEPVAQTPNYNTDMTAVPGNSYYAGQCTWYVKNTLSWVGNFWGPRSYQPMTTCSLHTTCIDQRSMSYQVRPSCPCCSLVFGQQAHQPLLLRQPVLQRQELPQLVLLQLLVLVLQQALQLVQPQQLVQLLQQQLALLKQLLCKLRVRLTLCKLVTHCQRLHQLLN